jgi:ParB-like chromosome segregation protein Spo0J
MDIPDFEPLKTWEYEALKADIAKRGPLVPIEFDQDTGEVVDGRNRLKICEELGITDYPRNYRHYTSDEERKLVGIVLNIYRRQLAPKKRNDYLAAANQLRLELGYDDEPVLAPVKTKKPSASDEPDALAARQREHRLRERIQPKHPLAPNADPWIVADEALDCLEEIRPFLAQLRGPTDRLDQAIELIKQLAWGPESLEASS